MKKSTIAVCIVVLLLLIIAVVTGSSSAKEKVEISRQVINYEYIEAHTEIETSYHYQFDILGEESFKLMPDTHTVHYDPEYKLEYLITYEDGTTKTEWETVTENEYMKAVEENDK